MSDCGVCLTGGYADCIGYRCVKVKAGQEWSCSECGCKIPRGSRYELASWFYADREGFGNAKTCLICAEIADAFYCGGRWHGGSLWDELFDRHEQLNVSCFNKLKTPEAKAELQRRWMEWKGL